MASERRESMGKVFGEYVGGASVATVAKSVGEVLKHYFRPGQEDFRLALEGAMPKLLTNGHKTAKEEMLELLGKVKPKVLRERMLKVVVRGCPPGQRRGSTRRARWLWALG